MIGREAAKRALALEIDVSSEAISHKVTSRHVDHYLTSIARVLGDCDAQVAVIGRLFDPALISCQIALVDRREQLIHHDHVRGDHRRAVKGLVDAAQSTLTRSSPVWDLLLAVWLELDLEAISSPKGGVVRIVASQSHVLGRIVVVVGTVAELHF